MSLRANGLRRVCLVSSILPRLLRLPFTALALPASSILGNSRGSMHEGSGASHVLLQMLAMAKEDPEEPETKPGSPAFYLKLGVVTCLVLIGGMLAGLTLALMSQDSVNLAVMEASGDDLERKRAGRLLRLLKKGQHWVLVTLLLYNTITNETLPIFLDSILGGGVKAVVSSTALILLFGEVIPQAICSRYGLAIGSASVPIMNVLMYASYPLSKPISILLDYVLGHDEGVTYKRAGLKTFVSLHRHLGAENLLDDEVTIISSVLELSEKSIRDIMVPVDDIYSLSSEQVLDEDTVTEILRQGYSRVPVYKAKNKSNFVGMLLVKNLVVYDPEDAKPVSSFNLIPLPEAEPGMSCLEALNFFQQGRSHMLLVTSFPGEDSGAMGIVSLEDVIEELIGEEIIDETDLFLDVANKIKVVRRPQIRTGAAKKLTPLLRDAANRRGQAGTNKEASSQQNLGALRRDSNRMSRSNSEAGSEAPSFRQGGGALPDYGTMTATGAATSGASTPRRRPSAPHRLGSLNTTNMAFDKVKIKGVTGAKKLEAMEAIRQNLEAIGSAVVSVEESQPSSGTASPNANAKNAAYRSVSTASVKGGKGAASGDSSVTITATTAMPKDAEHAGQNGSTDGDDGNDSDGHNQRILDAMERDEESPLLGGKQVAGSPTNY